MIDSFNFRTELCTVYRLISDRK